MDALVYLSDTFEWVAAKFDETGQAIDGLPLIGDHLAAPFYYLADKFQYVADMFDYVDDWWEWLKASFEALPVWDTVAAQIEATWSIVTKTWLDVTDYVDAKIAEIEVPDLPSWQDIFDHIKGMCVSAWDVLEHSWSDIEALIPTWDDLKPDWFPTSLDALVDLVKDKLPLIPTVDNIIEWVSDAFESILDRLFKEES